MTSKKKTGPRAGHPGETATRKAAAKKPEDEGSSSESTGRLDAVPFSSIASRRPRWLWDKRVPCGAISLLAGYEGIGKSAIAIDLLAQLSRGEVPGEFHGQPVSTLYLTTEDAPSEVLKPRFVAAGADMDLVKLVSGSVQLPEDQRALRRVIEANDAKLVVLDAATSVVNYRLDGNSDRHMRQALEPLSRVAEKTGAAILGLVHWAKTESADPAVLVTGSRAWAQVPRSVLSVMEDEKAEHVAVTVTKANYTDKRKVPTSAVRIREVTVSTDDGGHADTCIAQAIGEPERTVYDLLQTRYGREVKAKSRRSTSTDWLRDYFDEHGREVLAGDVEEAVKEHGAPSFRSVQRAAKTLGVNTEKIRGRWVWTLDFDQDEQDDTSPPSRERCRVDALSSSSGRQDDTVTYLADRMSSEDDKTTHNTSVRARGADEDNELRDVRRSLDALAGDTVAVSPRRPRDEFDDFLEEDDYK